jgi:fucose permease
MKKPKDSVKAVAAISSSPLPETAQTASASQHRRLLLTFIACIVYGSFALIANGWGPLLAPLASQFSLPLEQVGLLFVVWLIGYLPGALIGGSLLDVHGPRTVFLAAFLFVLSGMSLLFLALAFHVSWFFGLLLCAGLAGVGGGTIDASANAFMSGLYPHKRGAALNLFTALYPLSAMLISLGDGVLLLLFHNDARPSLLLMIGVAVFAFLLVFLLPHAPQRDEASPRFPKQQLLLPSSWFTQGKVIISLFLPVSIAILLTTGFTATIRTWTPAYLQVTYGQAPAFAALLSGFMNGLVLFFRLVVSLVVERIGTRATILLGLSVATGGLLAGLGSRSNVFIGTLALTVTAIGLTPLVATFMALGNERAAGKFSGSVTGFVLFIAGVSNVLWSWLFGVILNRAGSLWAIVSCLLPLICGILIVFKLRSSHETEEKKETE